MANKKTAVFDFDGVCATYDGWKGVDVFGEPIEAIRNVLDYMNENDWFCILFTTRRTTPKLRAWLKEHRFVFGAINSTEHNPADASKAKPIADIYIDDNAFLFQPKMPYFSAGKLMDRVVEIMKEND